MQQGNGLQLNPQSFKNYLITSDIHSCHFFKYTDSQLLGRKVHAHVHTHTHRVWKRDSPHNNLILYLRNDSKEFLTPSNSLKFKVLHYMMWSFSIFLLTYCQLAKHKWIKSNVKFWHNHKKAYDQNSGFRIWECHLETPLGKGNTIFIFIPGLQKIDHKATWRNI
jgi:hypothetical protein